jgi:flagellin-like protein
MNTKGVSAVIATILMLMITIALAGTAYLYITGIFTAKTAVALSIDGTASTCTANAINIVVKNDGTQVATLSSMTLTNPAGTPLDLTKTKVGGGDCLNILSPLPSVLISAGSFSNVTCFDRPAGAGLYAVVITTGVTSASGSIYCAS